MHATRIFTLAVTATWLACIVAATAPHDVAKAVFGGSAAFDSFRSAQRVTVERVHQKSSEALRTDSRVLKLDLLHNDSAELHVLAFYRSDAPGAVSGEDVRKLKQLLSDPHSYTWYWKKRLELGDAAVEQDPSVVVREVRACLPDYAVMFTFYGSPETVRVLLCFRCDQLAVLVGKGDDPLRVNEEDVFDNIRPQLLTIVKRLFPNDPDIQALPRHLEGT